jgi:peptide/nickel transport system permease protein
VEIENDMTQTLAIPSIPSIPTPMQNTIPSRSYWHVVARQLRQEPVAMASAVVLLLIVCAALFAPWLAPADPFKASMLKRLLPIGSPGYLLGTDELGRDMLTRLMYGGRLSLLMGVVPVFAAFFIGTSLGLFAGYVGGRVNMVIMRVLDVFYAFPSVLLAVAISGALGPGMSNSLIALTLVFVPQVVRVAESVTTQVRKLDYIEAARMSGAGSFSIIRVHVLGNVLGPVFVYATGLLSVSMILASGLSFLGLGVKPPEPEWGLMLNTLRSAIYSSPLLAALPGAFIFITSIAFNLLADGVRSAMDIRR